MVFLVQGSCLIMVCLPGELRQIWVHGNLIPTGGKVISVPILRDAGNWTSLVVPVDGASIVFDNAPERDCYLDGNRTVGNITNIQSTYKLIVNGKQLTVIGNLYFTNGAQIYASSTSSTVVFAGTVAQTIPEGAFTGNQTFNLTIDNPYGVTLQGDLTVINTLNLQTANPSDTLGCLATE